MVNGIFVPAGWLGFGFRVSHIGRGAANSSPPLRRVFGAGCPRDRGAYFGMVLQKKIGLDRNEYE